MALIIKNGTIVTALDSYRADLLIDGERIVAVGLNLKHPNADVIDATERLLLPGGVDAHTHIAFTIEDVTTSDDFITATKAAAYGGTTTVIDFAGPCEGSARPLQQGFQERQALAQGKSVIDYSFHQTVTWLDDEIFAEMDELFDAGLTSVKLFTDYPGRVYVDDAVILKVMRWARHKGALVTVHALNGVASQVLIEEAAAQGKLDTLEHGLCRPSILEGEATSRVINLAAVAGAPVYIVHVSCAEALQAVRRARGRGQLVFAETCPQYLYLDHSRLALPNFEGAKYVCTPPLRESWHAKELWQGLARGDIATLATDHCAFNFARDKARGRHDFRMIPNGLPGIEPRLALLHQGVVEGKITLQQFVKLTATAPAMLFGLYPRKGAIQVGSDADLVIWDPQRENDLSLAHQHMHVDYTPYEGWIVRGGPEKVFCRGRLIVDGDRFLGQAGFGQFIERKAERQPS